MKNRYLLISFYTIFGALTAFCNQPIHSSTTILKCKGQVPNKTACLIEPSSYRVKTYRVDICQRSPFPDFRSTPDYAGAGCMTLFNGNGNLYKEQLVKGSKYKPPKTGRDSLKPGTYNYLSIVFKNSFISSGKYTSGSMTWRTMGTKQKNINAPKLETSKGNPIESEVKLSNWRGVSNLDNDYCQNNGGTLSRCELNYNGYNLTGIGLGDNFVENNGNKIAYIFYMVDLLSPIILKEDSDGSFDITYKNGLEVYGNGSTVESITIAPFIFQANYN